MAEPSIGSPLSMHDPRQVGPWQIHSRLGAGGMGVVFYATSAGRAAAIKVIRPGLLDAPATRDRFRREVGILRAVRDVHICHYVDADLESEPAWLALEYLSGPVLRDEVQSNGPLADEDWWELARGLAQALAVLELHRVTHRDLKPGNVILNERGPVLIDFGIAHPEDATSLTATGLVTGSPAWLSPEQANLDPTGPATDIFTLGSLLAFAATGRPPFGEGASVAVLMSIIKRDPDLVGIDPVRTALLGRMLQKDPALRPSARQVLDLARVGEAGQDIRPMLAALGGTEVGGVAGASSPDALDRTRVDQAVPSEGPGSPGPIRSGPGASEPGATMPGGAGAAPATDGPHAAPPPADEAESWSVAPSPTDSGSSTQPDAAPPDLVQAPAAGAAGAAPWPAPTQPAPVPHLVSTPPPMTPGARTVRPRSAPPARRSGGRRWLWALLVVALLALVGWWAVTSLGGTGAPGEGDSGSSTTGPPSSGDAPPAPSSDQLRSGDWLLESYRLDNTADGLVVSGTVRNRGTSTASANLTVWVYVDGTSLGSVSGEVSDVAAGAAVPVTLRGDAIWKPGQKVVLLEAS